MIADIIKEKTEYTRVAIAQLERELQGLERQAAEVANKKGLEKWLNNGFESSSSLTPEFAAFARDFKKHVKDSIGDDFELVNWSRGHFEVSGFLKNKSNGRLVYFSTSDVRYFPNKWHDSILIRTAQHDRDWTGGSNCYTTLDTLISRAREMTSKSSANFTAQE